MGGDGGGGFSGAARMGRTLVPQSAAVQRVRGEAGVGPDHLQRRVRLFLQSPSARSV